MGTITFLLFVLLGADILYVGHLRGKGRFAVAHKMKKLGEQVLLPMLLVCAIGMVLQVIMK